MTATIDEAPRVKGWYKVGDEWVHDEWDLIVYHDWPEGGWCWYHDDCYGGDIRSLPYSTSTAARRAAERAAKGGGR